MIKKTTPRPMHDLKKHTFVRQDTTSRFLDSEYESKIGHEEWIEMLRFTMGYDAGYFGTGPVEEFNSESWIEGYLCGEEDKQKELDKEYESQER